MTEQVNELSFTPWWLSVDRTQLLASTASALVNPKVMILQGEYSRAGAHEGLSLVATVFRNNGRLVLRPDLEQGYGVKYQLLQCLKMLVPPTASLAQSALYSAAGYTELIDQLTVRIRERSAAGTVLIIDDADNGLVVRRRDLAVLDELRRKSGTTIAISCSKFLDTRFVPAAQTFQLTDFLTVTC